MPEGIDVCRRPRERERGSIMVLAMIVLTALATLSSLTVLTVQGGMTTASNDRFHQLAVYAAESGAAVTMDYLRSHLDPTTGWSAYVTANNSSPMQPTLLGNNAAVGDSNNLFSTDVQSSYSVELYNNRNDTGYATGADNDKRIVIRSTGYGPNGAVAVIEWEIVAGVTGPLATPCNTYAQRNITENGGGNADCLGTITNADTASIRPGG